MKLPEVSLYYLNEGSVGENGVESWVEFQLLLT